MRLILSLLALTVASPIAISHAGKLVTPSSNPFGERAMVVRVMEPTDVTRAPATIMPEGVQEKAEEKAAGFRLSSVR